MFNRRIQSGFSLIEALLAFLVVGIAFTALYKLQARSLQNQGTSRARTAALSFAQERIEDLQAFATLAEFQNASSASSSNGKTCDPTSADSGCKGANAVLTRIWSAGDCASAQPCKQVSVKVAWHDAAGQAQEVQLNTVLAAYERVKSGVLLAN